MKKLLVLVLLCVSFGVRAQTAATPFKGANVIYVSTPDSTRQALRKLARQFVEAGYSIDKIDDELGYFSTTPQAKGLVTPATFTYKAVATRKPTGTVLRLTGSYAVQMGLRTMSEAMYWVKSDYSQGKVAFAQAQKAAAGYEGAAVTYAKED